MKLRITFDEHDFSSMLEDFFQQAGYTVNTAELNGAKVAFNGVFPDGLTLSVSPNPDPPTAPVYPGRDVPPLMENIPDEEVSVVDTAIAPEDVVLPFSKVIDPEYQEMQSLLNLSKSIEKEKAK